MGKAGEAGEGDGAGGSAVGPAMPVVAWESPGEVARIAEATPELIRRYLSAGLISCVVDASGRRNFPPGTGERVRALKAERMNRRPRLDADASTASGLPPLVDSPELRRELARRTLRGLQGRTADDACKPDRTK